MSRDVSDPRVVEILAGFDMAAAMPKRADSPWLHNEPLANSYISSLVGFCWTEWSDEAMRAVLLAHAMHAPEADFEGILESSRRQVVWLAEADLDWKAEWLASQEATVAA